MYAVFPATVACEYGPMAAGALSVVMQIFADSICILGPNGAHAESGRGKQEQHDVLYRCLVHDLDACPIGLCDSGLAQGGIN